MSGCTVHRYHDQTDRPLDAYGNDLDTECGTSEAEWATLTEAMTEAGVEAGQDAASWVEVDTVEQADAILAAIDNCEFDIPAPLSGEWADGWTAEAAFSSAQVDPDGLSDEEASELLGAWEFGYTEQYDSCVQYLCRMVKGEIG